MQKTRISVGQTLRGIRYTAAQKFRRAVTAVMLKPYRSDEDSQRKHGRRPNAS